MNEHTPAGGVGTVPAPGSNGHHVRWAGPATRPAGPAGPAGRGVPGPRPARRPGLIALGLALAAAGAVIATTVSLAAGHRVAVLALTRPVPAGAALTAADLTIARIAPDPALRPIPATAQAGLLGEFTTGALPAGSLLTRAELTTAPVPAAGRVLVPVLLHPGQLPARPLTAGDPVLLVPTSPTAASTGPTTAGAGGGVGAVVAESGAVNSDGSQTVDLIVPAGAGGQLAALAAGGHVTLLLEPAGSRR